MMKERKLYGFAKVFAEKTHCPQGHEYSPENTRRGDRGERICRACKLARTKTWIKKQGPNYRRDRAIMAFISWLDKTYTVDMGVDNRSNKYALKALAEKYNTR